MSASTPQTWVRDDSKFQTIAPALRRSLAGGLVKASSLSDDEQAAYDDAVDAGVLTREARFSCRARACDKTWTLGNVPETCICGATYEPPIETPDSVVYFTFGAVDLLQDCIADSLLNDLADVHVTRDSITDITVSDIDMAGTESGITLHISPEFSFDVPAVKFFTETDVFLDWSHVPAVARGDVTIEDLQDAPMKSVDDD